MIRMSAFLVAAMLGSGGFAQAQDTGKVWGPPKVTEPWEALVFTEAVPRSEYPVDITLIETVDGLFTPIGIRRPKGPGPFPVVLFFSGNGGAGLQQVRDYVHNVAGYTMERFLEAGYAVAWVQYRAEAWFAWPGSKPLRQSKQQANQLMSRPPLEIDDLMTIVEYVKRLPYVDPKRVGLCGNSHGGGMILRATADGLRVRAAIVSEPDASEFLQMQEPAFAVENPIYRTPESAKPVLDKPVAMERIRRIDKDLPILLLNRDQDELQGVFETVYLWMKEAGRNIERVSYDHPVHGYIVRVVKDEKGVYRPDKMQLQAIGQAIAFFNKHMTP